MVLSIWLFVKLHHGKKGTGVIETQSIRVQRESVERIKTRDRAEFFYFVLDKAVYLSILLTRKNKMCLRKR